MCQQKNRASMSLLKAGGGDDRNVVRHTRRDARGGLSLGLIEMLAAG